MLRSISLSISFAIILALSLPSAAQTTFTQTSFVTDFGPSWSPPEILTAMACLTLPLQLKTPTQLRFSKMPAITNTLALIPRQLTLQAWWKTADFNNDGKLDLAVASDGQPLVTILTGVGNGVMAFADHLPLHFACGTWNWVTSTEMEPWTSSLTNAGLIPVPAR
jgi:hypothetical protein